MKKHILFAFAFLVISNLNAMDESSFAELRALYNKGDAYGRYFQIHAELETMKEQSQSIPEKTMLDIWTAEDKLENYDSLRITDLVDANRILHNISREKVLKHVIASAALRNQGSQ